MTNQCTACIERLEKLVEIFWLKQDSMTAAMFEIDRLQDEQRDLLEETRETLETAQVSAIQSHIHNKVEAQKQVQQARELRRTQINREGAEHGLSFQ